MLTFREVATGKKDKKLEELHPPMAPPKRYDVTDFIGVIDEPTIMYLKEVPEEMHPDFYKYLFYIFFQI
jgi:hypothetical protein